MTRHGSRYEIHGVLASQLQEFKISKWSDWNYSDLMNTTHLTSLPFEGQVADIPPTLTAKGLHICLPVLKLSDDEYLAYLYCKLWRSDQLMCMPLMPDREHPGENRFVRKREGDPFSFVPEEKLKSFRLVTMFIQQTPHYPHKFTLDLHSRYFSVVTFEVSATAASAISQNCMIMTSWGNNTTSLSWKTLIEEGMNSYSIQLSALVVLKPRDAFFVMFGSKFGRLWCCCVLLGDEYLDLVNSNQLNWDLWKEDTDGFIPDILADRAQVELQTFPRMVNVSIRKVLSQLVVSVRIHDPPNYLRLSWQGNLLLHPICVNWNKDADPSSLAIG
jgi:hypothetical protein